MTRHIVTRACRSHSIAIMSLVQSLRRRTTVALIAALSANTVARAQQTSATQPSEAAIIVEVRRTSRALDSALARGDTAELSRYYADAYVHIDQFGVRSGKEQRLAEFARGARRAQAVASIADEAFSVIGNVVVASAQTSGQQVVNGQSLPTGRRMSTRVWMRHDGRWQVILAQVTPIASR